MKQTYDINEQKINNWLDELNNDRNKLFSDIKTTTSSDKLKEDKLKSLENIQRSLLQYKKILAKEKLDSDK